MARSPLVQFRATTESTAAHLSALAASEASLGDAARHICDRWTQLVLNGLANVRLYGGGLTVPEAQLILDTMNGTIALESAVTPGFRLRAELEDNLALNGSAHFGVNEEALRHKVSHWGVMESLAVEDVCLRFWADDIADVDQWVMDIGLVADPVRVAAEEAEIAKRIEELAAQGFRATRTPARPYRPDTAHATTAKEIYARIENVESHIDDPYAQGELQAAKLAASAIAHG